MADNVYFGDSKRDGDGGYQSSGYASGGGYSGGYASGGYASPAAPAAPAAPSGYGAAPAGGDGFANFLTTTANCRFKS